MEDLLAFLTAEGIDSGILDGIREFRSRNALTQEDLPRVPVPAFRYYGKDVWEKAAAALLSGENILLTGPKATGKNVLAQNLASVFQRPCWDISFYLNIDAASLIGTDTFRSGEVSFRKGPVTLCAERGGFGILDEINMARNESLAVLHAALDFRRVIDIPGYERIPLAPATRFIATMNYGYAGTREVNEALASRFMIVSMPVISDKDLIRLLKTRYPALKNTHAEQLALLFGEIRKKCESSEISTKALDLRGLLSSVALTMNGLTLGQALEIGIVNKSFDEFERQLVADMIGTRINGSLTARDLFD